MEKGYYKFEFTLIGNEIIVVHAVNLWSAKQLVISCKGCSESDIINCKQLN